VTHWSYTRAGHAHRVYQLTTAAMRREVRRVAAPLGLRVGFWSAAESDPAAWAKIATALR
jgi:predicted nucleic acid-binding Zn ribbon protein